jgi:hypothetical protein
MSSNRTLATCFAFTLLFGSSEARATNDSIGCPPTHNGKSLKSVELFDGPPAERAELVLRDGGWDVPDPPLSPVLPNYTLGCTYRDSKEMVVVVLPRSVRVCEFPNYPRVSCH